MPECGRSLRRRGRGRPLKAQERCIPQRTTSGRGEVAPRTGGTGEGQREATGQLAGRRCDIWRASRQGAEQAGCHVEWALREPRGLRADRGGSFPPPERLRYSQESRTLLALSWRRGLRGLGLLPWGVGRPGAGAAPPPAGILGLPPARHSGGGGGRSGPAPVPTSPQHAAASGPCRRRRRRRLRGLLLGLLRSRLGRRRLSPFLVLLLRGSRLFRLPRHRGSSVPHPLVPGGGGGGGGGRGAAPPAPFASRSVRLNLTQRSSFPPPLRPAPRAPPPPPATQGPLPLAARAPATDVQRTNRRGGTASSPCPSRPLTQRRTRFPPPPLPSTNQETALRERARFPSPRTRSHR